MSSIEVTRYCSRNCCRRGKVISELRKCAYDRALANKLLTVLIESVVKVSPRISGCMVAGVGYVEVPALSLSFPS